MSAKLLILILFIIIFLNSFLQKANANSVKEFKYVRNEWEQKVATIYHKLRVAELSVKMKDLFPVYFADVNYDLLQEAASFHDFEKMKYAKSIYRLLWGKRVKDLPPHQKIRAEHLIARFNSLGDKVIKEFYKKNGLLLKNGKLSKEAKKIEEAIKIADLVDRGMDPVAIEEFGGTRSKIKKGSEFLTDPWQKEMARKLEEVYHETIKGLEGEKVLPVPDSLQDTTKIKMRKLQTDCQNFFYALPGF